MEHYSSYKNLVLDFSYSSVIYALAKLLDCINYFFGGGPMKNVSGQNRLRISNYSAAISIIAFTFCMMFSAEVFAQINTASINGTVRDTSGAVIPGASVVLHNVDTNVDRTSLTNDVGNYSFVDILPGHYTLSVSKPGF